MSYYRITLNDAHGPVLREYPAAQWSEIALRSEDRGWEARLERQEIFEGDIDLFMAGLVNPAGYVRFGNKVVTPWEILAEMKPRQVIVIGGD